MERKGITVKLKKVPILKRIVRLPDIFGAFLPGRRLHLYLCLVKVYFLATVFIFYSLPAHAIDPLISPNTGTIDISTIRQIITPYENQAAGIININSGGQVTNEGNQVDNYGAINVNSGGKLDNMWGMITNKTGGVLLNHGTVTDNGMSITNESGATVGNYSIWYSYGPFANDGSLTNHNGGTFDNNNAMASTGTLSNAGTWLNNDWSTLDNSGTLTNSGTFTNSSMATLTNSNALTNSGIFNNSGAFTNSGTLTVSSGGIFNQNNTATYSGAGSIILGGTLNNTSNNAFDITTLGFTGGTFNSNGTGSVSITTATVAGGQTGTIQGSGPIGLATADVDGTLNISAVISGTGSLTKTGAGTLTLSGANTYSGGTFINAGTLTVGSDANLGNASGGLTFTGGTLQVTGGFTTGRSVTLNAGGGTLDTNGNDLTISGVMIGAGSLTKTGAGTLVLTGANTYSGGTTVSTGTLQGDTSSLQGDITNDSQVIFDQAAAGTYAGDMCGTGTLIKTGAGTVTLTGSSCLGGGVTIVAGTLANDGAYINDIGATINNTAAGTLNNTGTLGNEGTLVNSGTLNNDNGGWLFNADGASMINNGMLNNLAGAQLTVQDGSFLTNNGTLTNNGWLGNDAGSVLTNNAALTNNNVLVNFAALTNNATLTNNVGASITNAATLTNNAGATLTNSGTFSNWAGAVFVNNGIFTNAGVFTNNGTLKGIGTIIGDITNDGIIAPGNSIGTMTITGNYTHNAGATYQVEVNAAGQSDRLVVTGTAVLNGGTVSVLASPGMYNVSTNYTILTAGSVTGTFASVAGNLAFLTPSLSYDPTHVYLLLTRNSTSFADVAQNWNQYAVASALDRASPAATGDMADVINTLLGLSASDARGAYDQMGGLTHNALTGVTFFSFNRYLGAVADRVGGFITGAPSSMFSGRPVMLASRADTGSDAGNTLLAALGNMRSEGRPRWGLWAQGYGGMGDRHGNEISSRYDYDLAGIVVGFDRKMGDSLLLGISMGYSHTRLNMKDSSDSATVSSYQGSLYGSYKKDPWYVNGIMAYGYNRYDTSRNIIFGGLARTANALYGGHAMGGYVETGYRLTTAVVNIIPMASIQGSHLTRDSFKERDAGALNLYVDRDNASSMQSSLGVRLRKEYGVSTGIVVPEIWGKWLHEFSNNEYTVNALFAGSPISIFTVKGGRPDRDSANAGLLLTWETKKGMDLYISYDAILSGDRTDQGGSLGMCYKW